MSGLNTRSWEFRLISLTLLSVGVTILLITSCATPVWRTDYLRGTGKLKYGLWNICAVQDGESKCFAYKNLPDKEWLLVSRFLITVSITTSVINIVYLVLLFQRLKKKKPPFKGQLLPVIIPVFTGLLAITATFVFIPNGKKFGRSYGFSFVMCLLAGIFSFISAFIFVLFRKQLNRIGSGPIYST